MLSHRGQWAMSRPADSALAPRSLSHLPLFATARLRTYSKSVGMPVKPPDARLTVSHRTPAFSRFARPAASVKRAMPHTSLSAARARAIGAATWPVGPVIKILDPRIR
jgi:hypothetical protein